MQSLEYPKQKYVAIVLMTIVMGVLMKDVEISDRNLRSDPVPNNWRLWAGLFDSFGQPLLLELHQAGVVQGRV